VRQGSTSVPACGPGNPRDAAGSEREAAHAVGVQACDEEQAAESCPGIERLVVELKQRALRRLRVRATCGRKAALAASCFLDQGKEHLHAVEPQQELALLTHKVPGEDEVSPNVRRRLGPVQQARPLRGRDHGRTPQSMRCMTQCGARPRAWEFRSCCFRC